MRQRRPRQTGLTLVEVLLAMAIMAMVMAALAQMQNSGARAALKASLTAEASVLCQSEMDAWIADGPTKPALDSVEPIAGSNPWTRRFTLQPLPSQVESPALSLLTVEVYRGQQRIPAFTLSRWVVGSGPGGSP